MSRNRIDPETGEVLDPGEYPSGRQTLYVISPFAWHEKGFVKLADVAQRTEIAALAEAEMMVALGRWVGAIVVKQTSDPDAGDYGEPEVLAMVGRVPEE